MDYSPTQVKKLLREQRELLSLYKQQLAERVQEGISKDEWNSLDSAIQGAGVDIAHLQRRN